jgi:hypothetical protein
LCLIGRRKRITAAQVYSGISEIICCVIGLKRAKLYLRQIAKTFYLRKRLKDIEMLSDVFRLIGLVLVTGTGNKPYCDQ